MSDTPRTDAAAIEVDVAYVGHDGPSSYPEKFVPVEKMAELERECNELRQEAEEAQKDTELLNALLTPAWHPVPKGWPYPATRGRYNPPYIVQYKASLEDGTPICITDTEPINTREKLRQAINRSAHDALKGGAK